MFQHLVIEIQNHGRPMNKYVYDIVNEAYIVRNSKTFLSSNLLRTQIWGLEDLMKDGKSLGDFAKKDFSPTGAARTMALDVKKWFRECVKHWLTDVSLEHQATVNR